jgi:hypothetical protein
MTAILRPLAIQQSVLYILGQKMPSATGSNK